MFINYDKILLVKITFIIYFIVYVPLFDASDK